MMRSGCDADGDAGCGSDDAEKGDDGSRFRHRRPHLYHSHTG